MGKREQGGGRRSTRGGGEGEEGGGGGAGRGTNSELALFSRSRIHPRMPMPHVHMRESAARPRTVELTPHHPPIEPRPENNEDARKQYPHGET